MVISVWITITLFTVLTSLRADAYIGPVKVTLHRFEKCAEDALGYKLNLNIHKINRTHQGINIDSYTPFPFGDDVDFNATVFKWGDGGWKPHFMDHYDKSACEFFTKYAKEKYEQIMTAFKRPTTCPLIEGVYEMENYIFDGELEVPFMAGEFKIQVELRKDGKLFTCNLTFVKTEPKNKLGII